MIVVGEGQLRTSIEVGTTLRRYLTFDCLSCHLAEMDAEEALSTGNLAAAANVMNMRYPAERRVALCAAALLLWRRRVGNEGVVAKFGRYITGCARMNEGERLELREVLARAEDGAMNTTIFDDIEAEGHAKGLAQGKAEGRAEAILDLIAARDLAVSEAARQQILACRDLETLRRWMVRAATVRTVDEIFSDA